MSRHAGKSAVEHEAGSCAGSDMTETGRFSPGRMEVMLIFILVAGLALAVGLRGRLADLLVNWDGLAAVAHAYDVFHAQDHANLAMIGFVQPPLPALLLLPLVLIAPVLATSGIAANVLGAICAGLSAVILVGFAADCGLPGKLRWPLVALLALHPMVLGPAACGAPMALLTTLLLGAAWGLLRWSRTEALRDLITSSLVLSGALITRYEAAFLVAGAVIYLAWCTWRRDRSLSKLEGTLIAFCLPIAYVAGIWIIANWAIMGDPWHFLRESFDAQPILSPPEMLAIILHLAIIVFFPVLALLYHQMHGACRYPAAARPVAWMVLTALLAPVIFPAAFVEPGADGYWASFVTMLAMVIAGGFAMLAAVLADLLRGTDRRAPVLGTAVILAASFGVAAWLYSDGAAAALSPARTLTGHGPLTASAVAEIEAATLLRDTTLPPGRRHLIAGWPGFAVGLLSGRTGEVAVIRTAELPAHVDALWVGTRLVLLVADDPGAVPPAAIDANLDLQPPLALEEQWTSGPWRCYRVIREVSQ